MTDLHVEDRAHVRCLTIDREKSANSITRDLARRLIDAVTAAGQAPEVHALMLTGAGDRYFCAGADLKELSDPGTLSREYTPILPELYAVVIASEKPVVAAINGAAVGGGMELALACDLRIAAAGARMGLPEIKQGLCPTFGTVALARLVPRGVALQLLLTGELVTAEALARWGLVDVVDPGELRAASWRLAESVAAAAPLPARKIKALLREGERLSVAEAMRLQVGPDIYSSEDRLEGLRAWRERLPPEWRGR